MINWDIVGYEQIINYPQDQKNILIAGGPFRKTQILVERLNSKKKSKQMFMSKYVNRLGQLKQKILMNNYDLFSVDAFCRRVIEKVCEYFKQTLIFITKNDFDTLQKRHVNIYEYLRSQKNIRYQRDDTIPYNALSQVSKKYQIPGLLDEYDFIFLDEIQEIDHSAVSLIKKLYKNAKLCATYDEDQNIGGWSDDAKDNYQQFQKLKPRVFQLGYAFRSSEKIANLAKSLINFNYHQTTKQKMRIQPNSYQQNQTPILIHFQSQKQQLQYICNAITDLINVKKVLKTNIAVLYRKHQQKIQIFNKLINSSLYQQIPYVKNMEILKLVIKAIANQDDFVSLDLLEFKLEDPQRLKIIKNEISKKRNDIRIKSVSASQIIQDLIVALKYQNEQQFIFYIKNLIKDVSDDFKSIFQKISDANLLEDQQNINIKLSIFDNARGLQVDHVFIINLNQQNYFYLSDQKKQEKQRRRLYIGMTIAKSTLTMSYSGKLCKMVQQLRDKVDSNILKSKSFQQYNKNMIQQDQVKKKIRLEQPIQPEDRSSKPLFIINNFVYLMTSSPQYKESYDVLAQISKPISRPTYIHEYEITTESIVKAITLGYDSNKIIQVLTYYMRNPYVPPRLIELIEQTTKRYNCAQIYLEEVQQGNFYFLEIDEKTFSTFKFQQRAEFSKDMKEYQNLVSISQEKMKKYIIDPYSQNKVAERLHRFNIPFHFQYAYKRKPNVIRKAKFKNVLDQNLQKGVISLKDLKIQLKTFTKLRNYQEAGLKSIFFQNEKKQQMAKSGIIVLPCGAGKTLLGISVACKIKKQTLIICSGEVGVEQWKNQILKWTSQVQPDQIIALTSKTEKQFKYSTKQQRSLLVISSYPFLSSKLMKKEEGFSEYEWVRKLPWGLVIFDEVQWLPAHNYKQILNNLMSHVRIGLTATPFREDKKIAWLNYLIGPQLYEGNWRDFVDAGFLANPYCIQIRVKMSEYFADQYRQRQLSKQIREILYCANPNKLKALLYLIKVHQSRGDQTIIFCDSIPLILHVARKLRKPAIYGQVPTQDKNLIFDRFRKGLFKTILLSRTGDQAIDLPNANVAIELTIHKGSRKQVLQRLGRIMRQKDNPTHEYNAFFYTLVSEQTSQRTHFSKRQKCLVNLGFQYDILNESELEYHTPGNQYYQYIRKQEVFEQAQYLKNLLKEKE